jgi:DNA-binding transcriptional LysR family regulator
MKIEDLGTFLVLYKHRNFSDAAKELFITQSALTKRLQSLQQEVGTELISTSNRRRVEITERGEVFCYYAKVIINEYELMQNEIKQYGQMKRGHLWVAGIPGISLYGLTEAVSRLMHDYPTINVRIEEIEGDTVLSRLGANAIDVGILRDLQSNHLNRSVYRRVPIARDELKVILPASAPQASSPSLTMSDLRGYDFVLLNKGSGVYETVINLCREAGFTPDVLLYSTHIGTVMQVVDVPNRVTFLFGRPAEAYINSRLVMRSFATPIYSDLEFVYVPDQNREVVELFLRYVQSRSLERPSHPLIAGDPSSGRNDPGR